MTPEQRAKKCMEEIRNKGYYVANEWERIVCRHLEAAIVDGASDGRAQIPNAPVSDKDLAQMEQCYMIAGGENREGMSEVQRLVWSDLGRALRLARYLSGPILDALAMGELDQWRAGRVAGLEEAVCLLVAWEESSRDISDKSLVLGLARRIADLKEEQNATG